MALTQGKRTFWIYTMQCTDQLRVNEHFTIYRAVSLWNSLPHSLKNIDTLTHFKVEYKRMLLEEFLTESGV